MSRPLCGGYLRSVPQAVFCQHYYLWPFGTDLSGGVLNSALQGGLLGQTLDLSSSCYGMAYSCQLLPRGKATGISRVFSPAYIDTHTVLLGLPTKGIFPRVNKRKYSRPSLQMGQIVIALRYQLPLHRSIGLLRCDGVRELSGLVYNRSDFSVPFGSYQLVQQRW
ncbi:uncharacterized protein BJX67DRAFT_23097 [Aspergillus lucknowensis]|uniref:Uncharacterized protein n=1 Tax=Aspergillus lucknowensis TaxID=176173 RepID=A0ABR4LXL2_9EURO